MFRSYLKTAIKNVLRDKGYAAINVLGLAIGLAACFLIILYIQQENSYDRFHSQGDRIFRMTSEYSDENGYSDHRAATDMMLAPLLAANFPELQHVVRIQHGFLRMRHDDQVYTERNVH